MTTPSIADTARFIANILAHRQTPPQEVPDLILNVYRTLAGLHQAPSPPQPLPQPDVAPLATPRPRRARQARRVAAPRGEAPPLPPPAPKLLRRAEVVSAPSAEALVAPRGAIRGIVKWFDRNTGKGALRLPGCSGDVAVDMRILAEAGIARLYKGQEIEATITGTAATPELVRLALPGSAETSVLNARLVAGRRAKPVIVELKREALRRAAARAEAEQVLGSRRTPR